MRATDLVERFGFELAGSWVFDKSYRNHISFELKGFQDDRVIYAFVIGSKVMYIGNCRSGKRTLIDRMRNYRSASEKQPTSARVAKLMEKHLRSNAKNERILIYALKPKKRMSYSGLSVDLVNGLEHPLIDEFGPEWNLEKIALDTY